MKFKKGFVYTIQRRADNYYYWPKVWNHWKKNPQYLRYRSAALSFRSAKYGKRTQPNPVLVVTEYKQELTEIDTYEISI